MNVRDALDALANGERIQRPGSWVLELQKATVPILTEPRNPNCTSWNMCRFPVIADHPINHDLMARELGAVGAPYAFTDEDMNGDDWDTVP